MADDDWGRAIAKVYPGLHEPLIPPDIWDSVQEELTSNAATDRTFIRGNRSGTRPSASPLAGKIFDQTGDRLTPSHTKTRKGRRLRYYVPRRLTKGTASRDPSGWRLPAPELEKQVGRLVAEHLARPEVCTGIICDATTEDTVRIRDRLSGLDGTGIDRSTALALVDRVDIAPGEMRIAIATDHLATLLDTDETLVDQNWLQIRSPFQHRKRGVETKLIIGDAPAGIDETLLRNIGRGVRYFELVRSGMTFTEVAKAEGVSKDRVQKLIEFAFLAPDIIQAVLRGNQPPGLNTEWLLRHVVPALWSEQRALFATL